jgi:hypothetical protein
MAKVYRTDLIAAAADLIKMNQDDIALSVLTTLGKFEIAAHLHRLKRRGIELPKTFGDLHDTCDANELGGLCRYQIFDAFPREGDGMSERHMRFANDLQDRLDAALVAGLEPCSHVFY